MKQALALLAAAVCAGPGLAQATRTTTTTTTTHQYHKVSAVVGTQVTLQNDALGKVTEVVINDGGCIEYVVVGYGEQFVAIPWGAVRVDYGQRTVTVTNTQITRDRLREVAFAANQWPTFGTGDWGQKMQTVWGTAALRPGADARDGDRRDRPNADPRNDRRDNPGTNPQNDRRDDPGTNPGTNRQNDRRDNPGTAPGNDRRDNPGTNPADRPGTDRRPGDDRTPPADGTRTPSNTNRDNPTRQTTPTRPGDNPPATPPGQSQDRNRSNPTPPDRR